MRIKVYIHSIFRIWVKPNCTVTMLLGDTLEVSQLGEEKFDPVLTMP